MVAVVEKISDDRDLGSIGIVRAAADTAGGIGRAVAMNVHEDVPFDPRVGAVEIQNIVIAAVEYVVDELHDGPRPVATGEIDRVIVTDRLAKKVAQENPATARFDAAV